VSAAAKAWLRSLGGASVLGVPATAQAAHPGPGSEVPWVLILVAAVLVFAGAWVLTVYFERRQKTRSSTAGAREEPRTTMAPREQP
jgi:hypothetical protein